VGGWEEVFVIVLLTIKKRLRLIMHNYAQVKSSGLGLCLHCGIKSLDDSPLLPCGLM
jgi:hypothetical protein